MKPKASKVMQKVSKKQTNIAQKRSAPGCLGPDHLFLKSMLNNFNLGAKVDAKTHQYVKANTVSEQHC